MSLCCVFMMTCALAHSFLMWFSLLIAHVALITLRQNKEEMKTTCGSEDKGHIMHIRTVGVVEIPGERG